MTLPVDDPGSMEADGEHILDRLDRLIAEGRKEDAIASALKAGAASDDSWLLGGLSEKLIDLGAASEATAMLERLRDAGSAGSRILTLLGRAQSLGGNHAQAIETLREACYLDGRSADALNALGEARLDADDIPAAIADFERALRIAPDDARAHFRLGDAWARVDERDKAARHFRAAAEADPADRRGAAIRLAELDLAPPPAKASNSYVRHLFDGYAPRYDEHMTGTLRYRGPDILYETAQGAWAAAGGAPPPGEALDIGCGTGLSGAAFKPRCARLTGIDLSPRMAAAAMATGHYDEVVLGEAVSTLESLAAQVDLAIACDTLIYIGDLEPIFGVLSGLLRPGGWFVFTNEEAQNEPAAGYEVGPSRRFGHSEAYLREMAARHGFEVHAIERCAIRTEQKVPVPAFSCAFRRHDGAAMLPD